MNRIATAASYSAVLANLMAAEARQTDASNQVATQKKATDLKGYAGQAETLTAMQAVKSRIDAYIPQAAATADRLTSQDTAINQVGDAAQGARQAITDALASGDGSTLMQSLRNYFSDVTAGLNTKYNGNYLFAGGQVNTAPLSAASMSDLTAAPTTASLFHNDQLQTTSKLDDTTTIPSGFLADKLGTGVVDAFKAVQGFVDANGDFNGPLTDAQKTFLQGQLAGFDTAHNDLVNAAGQNGLMQTQVTSMQADLTSRQTSLQTMLGGITDADVATAVSNLQQAQIAVQASAQVFTTLKASSLVNLLPQG